MHSSLMLCYLSSIASLFSKLVAGVGSKQPAD